MIINCVFFSEALLATGNGNEPFDNNCVVDVMGIPPAVDRRP